jgi:hypothetical protein
MKSRRPSPRGVATRVDYRGSRQREEDRQKDDERLRFKRGQHASQGGRIRQVSVVS